MVTKHTTIILAASLHYLAKYNICKINHYLVNIMNKSLELNFLAHPVRQYRFMFTNTGSVAKTKHNLTYGMGQKLSSKLLFISSPNTDGFYRFYISQGSVETQLG